jgi:hypothetical protein
MDAYLKDIYYDPANPASFSGPLKLYRAVKNEGQYNITLSEIKKWLQKQEPYTIHRQLRRKFPRNRVIVAGIDDQWDVDLMDLSSLAKFNDGIHYILLVIDIFSKFVWLRSLRSKTGKEVAEAFQSIFSEGRIPKYIRSDKGQEFKAQKVQTVFKKEKVHHFVTQNEVKANYAERAIKTIKSKIFRYLSAKQTYRYIDVLSDIANSYNHTYHRTIGMSPVEVTKQNETSLWWTVYAPKTKLPRKRKFKFRVGDYVRISHLRAPFTREYDEKWTGEIFKISERFYRSNLPIYRLIDFHNEEVKGTFYEPELQKVIADEDTMWKVEKILKTRTRKGEKEYYVKWMYWPNSFNSWVKASDMTQI